MMKLKLLFGVLIASLCTCSLVSCQSDEDDNKVEIVTVTVASQAVEKVTTLFLSDIKYLTEYLKVTEGNSSEWMDLNTISGFRFKDGTEYQLQVEKTYLRNPPADGPSITYRLIKVLSESVVNKEIAKVERFYTGECMGRVEGEKLTEIEKGEVVSGIMATMPWSLPYVVYKFVYTDTENPKGNVIIYTGQQKKEGTFERAEENPAYTLTVDGIQTTYTMSRAFTRFSPMIPMAFISDVTATYQVAYPNLTKALIQLPILKIQ